MAKKKAVKKKKTTLSKKGSAPNLTAYHATLRDELDAVRNRIRHLVTHWPTDGSFKEAALRAVLRRHLPQSVVIGRGFIVDSQRSSTEIDILITNGNKPTLFKDGDLLIVSPSAVEAVIEVKTSQTKAELKESILKLAEVKAMCSRRKGIEPFAGLYVYESLATKDLELLKIIREAWVQHSVVINSLASGSDRLVKYLRQAHADLYEYNYWQAGEAPGLAITLFIGSVLESLASVTVNNDSVWYPAHPENKFTFHLMANGATPTKGVPSSDTIGDAIQNKKGK